jgi:hypothetical protein
VNALFADLAERSREQRAHNRACLAYERTQVLALFDAVQVAFAQGQHDRVGVLLKQMDAIVSPVLARRRTQRLRISA